MKIYIEVINERIIGVSNMEMIVENYLEIDASNIDEFFKKIIGLELNPELEDEIRSFFDNTEADDEHNSLETYNIKHWVSNRSFGELIDMYENNEIEKPDMQRQFVWDSLKCSRLIESIVLGLPIPPLFLLETETNKYEIIDGFQRLTTLVNYVNGKPWNYTQNMTVDSTKRVLPSKCCPSN